MKTTRKLPGRFIVLGHHVMLHPFHAACLPIVWIGCLLACCPPVWPAELPQPGIGIFFKATEVEAMRGKILREPCRGIYQQMLKQAEAALAKWPEDKRLIEPLAAKLPDLTMEFVPEMYSPPGGKNAGKILEAHATQGAPAAAFVFLMTGDRMYADFAWEVFEQCARVNRWGWFPWSGAHMPQIHFGTASRNLVLIADAVWETLTPVQRQQARQAIAEKCVEPYYRLVLHTPGMGLYHLRSRNQGNNALAAAMIGSLFAGDVVPENRIWFNSLLQTFHWAITHDIGWMGQGLEMDLGGYWSVSMQNLYTAAVALNNVKGIDLRSHPGFEQATYYPMVHEATVPPVGMFSEPISTTLNSTVMGIIDGKPIGLPADAEGAAWWLDYAARFPDSPAHYFISKGMIRGNQLRAGEAHQGRLSQILQIAWWQDSLLAPAKPPTNLALFTDRMAGIRSGYGFGETYLYFNGDLFLSAKKEILATTSGLAWHFPWHQYQITESGLETEGELFAPSMMIKEARSEELFTYFRAEADFSNVAYYPQSGQRESHTHYAKHSRHVLYVRGASGRPDYFLFDDEARLKNDAPRWHAWTWHLWNTAANPRNFGRFLPIGKNAVRASRPNADLWIQFLNLAEVAVEQHGIPSQPHVNYQMDHNAQMLRAIAGGYKSVTAHPVMIQPEAWQNLGVVKDEALYLEKPPTNKDYSSQIISGLQGSLRYRWAMKCKKENYRVYEATAWEVSLELLNAQNQVVARPTTPYGHPHPLKLGAPLSDKPTHDWAETVQYFDTPADTVACRAVFRAVGGAHYFTLGKLWLSPIELQPVGEPHRQRDQRMVTLVMPLNKDESAPRIEPMGESAARVIHPDQSIEEIVWDKSGLMRVTQRKAGQVLAAFSNQIPNASAPLGELKTNSELSAKKLAAGLKPVLDQLRQERDILTTVGRTNLALSAKVTASAFRDARFSPSHIIDNLTAEYPADGHLDYTQGIVWSSGRTAGYGTGRESLLRDRDYFPLYVKPTYWLLPEGELGWIELALPEVRTIDKVRLLNTSNTGLNDFATHTFRVELYDTQRRMLASQEGRFGQVFDRPFSAAFVAPEWFNHYTPTFAGMLEPGLTVPFGNGWQEINFAGVPAVASVRIVITKYWGLGGGLNEVQVYGK